MQDFLCRVTQLKKGGAFFHPEPLLLIGKIQHVMADIA